MKSPESAESRDHAASAAFPAFSALAASIRRAVVEAGEAAYEDAGIQGLCAEGRWEAAVAAMRAVDVDAIARRAVSDDGAADGDSRPSTTG